jgi:hypothetical protein
VGGEREREHIVTNAALSINRIVLSGKSDRGERDWIGVN